MATATMQLVNKSGAAQASLSSVSWAWFDEDVGALNAPVDKGNAEVTDGTGEIVVTSASTTLISGQIATIALYDPTGGKIGVYRVTVD